MVIIIVKNLLGVYVDSDIYYTAKTYYIFLFLKHYKNFIAFLVINVTKRLEKLITI